MKTIKIERMESVINPETMDSLINAGETYGMFAGEEADPSKLQEAINTCFAQGLDGIFFPNRNQALKTETNGN